MSIVIPTQMDAGVRILSVFSRWEWTPSVVVSTASFVLALLVATIIPSVREYLKERKEAKKKKEREYIRTVNYLNIERQKLLDLRRRVRYTFGEKGTALIEACDSDWDSAYKNIDESSA